MRHQAANNRDVVHLLHATPALRGTTRSAPVQPIQDLITLRDIDVSVAAATPAEAAKLVPSVKSLDFTQKDSVVAFTVPSVTGNEMIEIAY